MNEIKNTIKPDLQNRISAEKDALGQCLKTKLHKKIDEDNRRVMENYYSIDISICLTVYIICTLSEQSRNYALQHRLASKIVVITVAVTLATILTMINVFNGCPEWWWNLEKMFSQ